MDIFIDIGLWALIFWLSCGVFNLVLATITESFEEPQNRPAIRHTVAACLLYGPHGSWVIISVVCKAIRDATRGMKK